TRWPRDWSSDVCSSDLEEPPRIRLRQVRGAERCALGSDALAQRPRGHLEVASDPRAGSGCTPAETVSTSQPSAVTATVCSHCAEIGRASCRERGQKCVG